MSLVSKSFAYILLTDKVTESLLVTYDNISSNIGSTDKVFIAYHCKDGIIPESVSSRNNFIFTDDILNSYGYLPIQNKLVPGSNHFPLLAFSLIFDSFDYYWYIEDDVRFTGNWGLLFDFFNNHSIDIDFISCHVRRFDEEPEWYWWQAISNKKVYIPLSFRIRSFNPIMRLSKNALRFLHNSLFHEHWSGHHEVLIPTLLFLGGFLIADFGGKGSFVMDKMHELFYTEDLQSSTLRTGTMRFRPLISELKERNKLYHPVK